MVRELADIVNTWIDRIHYRLHDIMVMKRLSAQWVPLLLTVDQKRIRMNNSQECLDLFKRDSAEFIGCFIMVDETWIHYRHIAQTFPPAGKAMTSVLWDSRGMVLI